MTKARDLRSGPGGRDTCPYGSHYTPRRRRPEGSAGVSACRYFFVLSACSARVHVPAA